MCVAKFESKNLLGTIRLRLVCRPGAIQCWCGRFCLASGGKKQAVQQDEKTQHHWSTLVRVPCEWNNATGVVQNCLQAQCMLSTPSQRQIISHRIQAKSRNDLISCGVVNNRQATVDSQWIRTGLDRPSRSHGYSLNHATHETVEHQTLTPTLFLQRCVAILNCQC